jgi:hypothetical protein
MITYIKDSNAPPLEAPLSPPAGGKQGKSRGAPTSIAAIGGSKPVVTAFKPPGEPGGNTPVTVPPTDRIFRWQAAVFLYQTDSSDRFSRFVSVRKT